jgi:Fic family protein
LEPLKDLNITPAMLQLVAEIDAFNGRWQALGRLAPERLSALKRIATIESIASSTRIEGVKLSDSEVDQFLRNLAVQGFRSRDEQEVAGYADAMQLVFDAWPDLALTENHIKQLHGVLLRHTEKDQRHRGHYKQVPNHVTAFDDEGNCVGIVFATATSFDTPQAMSELIDWVRRALQEKEDHALLVIATFVVRFLAIHPFQDGNGRLSRVLTTLMLLKAGYPYVPYASLERVIEDNKDSYYRTLRQAQQTLNKTEEHLGVWILFFLRSLARQKECLLQRIEREKLTTNLTPLAETLLLLAREHGRLSMREALRLTQAPRSTIKMNLKNLVISGHLSLHGKRRGTWYEAV